MDLTNGERIERWRQAVTTLRDLVSTRCFPPDDVGFASLVERALRDPVRWNCEGVDPERLETRLRRVFPRVRVQPRSSLADFGGWATTWYVYRDGHYDTRPAPDRWWLDPSLPRVLADADGRCVDANRAALDALGVADCDLTGRLVSDLFAPEARPYVSALPRVARERGSVETAALLEAATGGPVEVAVHLSVDPRTGHHLIVLRRI